jgi:uncharacterized membrane protein
MYSKIKLFGHPVHPMFVGFPITLYTAAFVCFIVYQANGDPFWFKVAYYSNIGGVLTALLAAVPGFLDWFLGIPKGVAAKKRGLIHAALNVTALTAFAINIFVLRGTVGNPPATIGTSILLTGIGFMLTMAAGYHGFALIGTHKVGVDLTPEQERLEAVHEMNPHKGTT